MASLYILQSETVGRFYAGSSNELDRRLQEHARGHSLATRGRGPWKLVHREEFGDLASARCREYEIKQWKSERRHGARADMQNLVKTERLLSSGISANGPGANNRPSCSASLRAGA
ncbi:MAG: GIY-YIG nuclease family protein [Candidatus Acidiferrales bacterium]